MHGRTGEQRGERRIGRFSDERITQAAQQDELEPAALNLLIASHELDVSIETEIRRKDRQACALEQGADTVCIRGTQESELLRELRREHHAHGDGLAMKPAVARAGFYRMT